MDVPVPHCQRYIATAAQCICQKRIVDVPVHERQEEIVTPQEPAAVAKQTVKFPVSQGFAEILEAVQLLCHSPQCTCECRICSSTSCSGGNTPSLQTSL